MTDNKQLITPITNYIATMQKEIYSCNKRILALKDEISSQKVLLYNKCSHEWYIDRDDCWDSICNRRCKHCDLWQNQSCN